MVLEVDTNEAWELIKLIKNYQDYRKICLNIDILTLIKEGKNSQEIIDILLEKILNENKF